MTGYFPPAKCTDPEERELFVELTPDEAKRRGRRAALRPDWEDIRFSVMEEVVRAKFTQNPHLMRFQDISQVRCDCIVNASDETLSGYGGVDAAIHKPGSVKVYNSFCRALGGQ